MRIGRVCTRQVVSCDRGVTGLEVARLMRAHHVGDVVVVEEREGQRVPVGIVTDRDLVVELMAKSVDAQTVTAGEIMGGELVVADENEDVYDTVQRMRWKGVRRIPVINASGGLVCIATLDDLNQFLVEAMLDLTRIGVRQHVQEERLRA